MPHPLVEHVALDAFNTFGLAAHARRYAEIHSPGQLQALIREGALAGETVRVLGGGSNVILGEEIDACVLHMRIQGREWVGSDENDHFVRAGAGENWHDFVRWTLEMGWPGLENLSSIPGTVGAAPVQNIGAYGLEMCERFLGLEAVDLRSGAIVSFDFAACQFDYRDSLFKHEGAGRFVITAVTFRLPKRWNALTRYLELERELASRGLIAPTPLQVSDAIIAIRARKLPDPAVLGNAGSFFKNPLVTARHCEQLLAQWPSMPHHRQLDGREKLAAGWLIEQAGWRGKALGPVGMYEGQALVMVRHAPAASGDVLALAQAVSADVKARFGVSLEMEPAFF